MIRHLLHEHVIITRRDYIGNCLFCAFLGAFVVMLAAGIIAAVGGVR